MIALIEGEVVHIAPPFVYVLSGGVGYEIEVGSVLLQSLSQGVRARVIVHHVVREDAQSLFGFDSFSSRQLFRTLIRVNGVGAKMAMALMELGTSALIDAVASGNHVALTKVSGVGAKTAQRLVMELSGKLSVDNLNDAQQVDKSDMQADALGALVALGYREKDAIDALKLARLTFVDVPDTQALIKAALRQLS